MEQLIDEFIDLAQIQSGTPLSLSRGPIDLVELASYAVDTVQASSPGQHVLLEIAQPCVIGCWDGPRLRRVLENLLNNAIKYSARGGDIVMHVGHARTPEGSWAVLAVRDHGRGIPTGDQPYIFEPFRRGSNVGQVAGSGLGLASVQRIVEAHGGSIMVQSREGEGTTVTMRLPRE
jgi:signal transduction histidine kinase